MTVSVTSPSTASDRTISNPVAHASPPPAARDAKPDYPPSRGLGYAVADLLAPLFNSPSVGAAFAQQAARNALDEYHPETAADYVNTARTLAFSFAALSLLGDVIGKNMPLPEQMLVFARANALNHSAEQSERTMMRRRKYLRDNPLPPTRPSVAPAGEPPTSDRKSEVATVKPAVAKAPAVADTIDIHDAAINLGKPKIEHHPDTEAKPAVNPDRPPTPFAVTHHDVPPRATTAAPEAYSLRKSLMHGTTAISGYQSPNPCPL